MDFNLRKKMWLTLVGSSLAVASAVYAEEEADEKVGEIVVTATKTAKEKKDVAVAIETVSSEDIQKKGGQNIIETLRGIPGVTVSDNGGNGLKYIRIRGESSRRTLILIDGQPLSQQKSMDGGMPLVGKGQIERIEVIKGPSSVLHGSEAIGGVVNIITKKSSEDTFGGSIGYQFDSSNDGFRFDQEVHGNVGDFEYVFTYGRSDYGDRETPDKTLKGNWVTNSGEGLKYGTGSISEEFSGYIGYKKDSLHMGAKFEKFDMSYETYSDTFGKAIPAGPMDITMSMNIPESRRTKYSTFFEVSDLTDSFKKLRLDLYRQSWDRDFDIHNQYFSIPMAWDYTLLTNTHNVQETYGAELQSDWEFGDHYVVAGLNYTRDDIDGTTKTKRRYGNSVPVFVQAFEHYKYDSVLDTYAAYIQDEWKVNEKLSLTIGGRYTFVDHELKSTTDPNIAASSGSDEDGNIAFSLGAVYHVNDELTLRSTVSQGYRHANLVELYTGSPAHGGAAAKQGNTSLDPETSTNYEIGARYDNGSWTVDASAFYTSTKDYITTDATKFINVGGADTFGVELVASYLCEESGLRPYASLTFLRRRLDYDGQGTVDSTYDSGVAPLTGRVGVDYLYEISDTSWMQFDLFSSFSTKVDMKYSDGTTNEASSWETLNLEFTYGLDEVFSIGESSPNLSLFAGIYNIFDREYTAYDELTAPKRHVVLGLNSTF